MKWLNDEELKDLLSRGFEKSELYDTEEEATTYALYLKELNRDPSHMVSVAGLYSYLDHYPQVIYKHTVLN